MLEEAEHIWGDMHIRSTHCKYGGDVCMVCALGKEKLRLQKDTLT